MKVKTPSAESAIASTAGIGGSGACLQLPPARRTGWYLLGMVVAILIFGGGGVVGTYRQLRAVWSDVIPFPRGRARGHVPRRRIEASR